MATTSDYIKKYQKMEQNGQPGVSTYLSNMRQGVINQQKNVLSQKYNDPQNYQSHLNKLQNDISNIDKAQGMYQNILQNTQDQQRQASLGYQQGLKYAPSQLNMAGLGQTGLSETSQVGLMNAYQNILQQQRSEEANKTNQLYRDLLDTQRESDLALQKETMANEQAYKDRVIAGMAQAQSVDELEQYRKLLGEKLDPLTQIQYENRVNAIKNINDMNIVNKKYGIEDPNNFYDINSLDNSMFNFKEITNPNDPQYELINLLKANNNVIPNGTVIDINIGKGTSAMLFYNGKLYPTSAKPNPDWQGSKLYEKLGGQYYLNKKREKENRKEEKEKNKKPVKTEEVIGNILNSWG